MAKWMISCPKMRRSFSPNALKVMGVTLKKHVMLVWHYRKKCPFFRAFFSVE